MVARNVLRDPQISPEAKGLYAYLAGFAGEADECFPSVSLICAEMAMSKSRMYRHMDMLVASGIVERKQTYNGNIKGRVIYKIADGNYNSDNRFPRNTESEKKHYSVSEKCGIRKIRNPTELETNNNSFNNSIINNNKVDYQQIADMYNNTCVSFPRVTKLSDARKKAIKARLNTYTVEDFQRLFTMAEESSFLKGKNNRNWSANFDWLLKDSNIAKVLDGNYSDKSQEEPPKEPKNDMQQRINEVLRKSIERGDPFGEDAPFK